MVGATTLEVAKFPVPKTGGLPLTPHPEETRYVFFYSRSTNWAISPRWGELDLNQRQRIPQIKEIHLLYVS